MVVHLAIREGLPGRECGARVYWWSGTGCTRCGWKRVRARACMRFLWVDLLWLLLIVPLLIAAYVYALKRRKKLALRYASLLLVRDALGPGQWLRRHLPAVLVVLALTCALIGVGRPTAVLTLPNEHQTIVLAMDVSRSMRAMDIQPSRIEAAQNAVKAFVKELPPNVRIGIVTFAGTAAVAQTP